MSEIKTKIRTYNDVIDLFGEEKAADMLSEALDWSTIDPKNDKKNIMECKPLLLDPYMTYEDEDYCKHIVAGFLGDRDLGWASGYIDEEKIKNGQVMPADLKSALSMALDNELSTSCAYLDALSSQCAEIFNKFAGYIEFAGLARGVLVPGEYELDYDALNADVSERFNIQYGFQCDQMIDAMQFDMTLILTEKVDSMDGYRLIQSVCACRDAEEYDLAPCFIVPARKEYMQEQEIMNVCELYPELIDPDGEIIWSDPDFAKQGNEKAAGPDNFPGHELNDHKNPDQSWISVIPVQMYWKDDPSELVEANFSIEDTYGLAIDEQITFSGYNENELVDMIGREDNGEDFVITGVGPQSSILTEKKNPALGRRLSDKQAKAKTAAGRLDAEREPKAGIPIHDEESK